MAVALNLELRIRGASERLEHADLSVIDRRPTKPVAVEDQRSPQLGLDEGGENIVQVVVLKHDERLAGGVITSRTRRSSQ